MYAGIYLDRLPTERAVCKYVSDAYANLILPKPIQIYLYDFLHDLIVVSI